MVNIGAGDVQLIGCNAFGLIEPLDDPEVLTHCGAEDIDDDLAEWISLQRGQLAFNEVLHADVLQTDGVDHAGRGLHYAWSGIAGHRLQRYALADQTADSIQRDDLFKFNAVAKGAAGSDDGVDQFQAGQRNSHVGLHVRRFPQ